MIICKCKPAAALIPPGMDSDDLVRNFIYILPMASEIELSIMQPMSIV